jgi:hypothetical protein
MNFWEEEYKELWQAVASWIDARPDQEDEALKALRQQVGLRHPNRVKRRES